jgi:hypothetical protein
MRMRLTILLAFLTGLPGAVEAQTFNVTGGNNIDYTINGQPDPGFTLQRGVTYVFQIGNLPFHPFWIKTNSGFGGAGAYPNGVVNNGATSGNITFTVPADAPNSLLYQCGNHGSMLGTLTIVTPATPPTVRIVHLAVGPNIVVTSTGTNGWSAIPEFKCDAAATNWTAVVSFTNSFANGTNTTRFDRLDAICGSPAVFLRIRNQPD